MGDSRWIGSKQIKSKMAEDDTLTKETNSLRHDVPGRVSMKKGGGTFDFTIAPVADAKWLDKTNVVIGQVLEGMDLVDAINDVKMYGGKSLRIVKIFKSQLLPVSAPVSA